ncbi:MAG: 4-hydroxy 2-oxovalerate aldolase [Gaiellales bacterium]|nr:4-hydroxy 2-oxovalerate aldolase [Gaiellales bacterium]
MSVRTVRILDATLRDGSHAIRHRFTPEQVREIAGGLDSAGVYAIGVGHGDGLGGSSLQLGLSLHSDEELIAAAASVIEHARLAVTLVPGIGTKDHLRRAAALGARLVRIATHCTEADVSVQHIALARELELEVHGDLMLPHLTDPASLAEQAAIMAAAGAQGVYLMDSAGALLPDDVRARVSALRARLGPDVALGMHAHDNLSLAIANTLAAVEEGATLADGCLVGLGAGAGNARTEVIAAVLERAGFETGLDLFALQDLADHVVRPIGAPVIDRLTATLGYAGVPSSLLLPAGRAAERFGVDAREVLVSLGRRGAVTGQEDLVIELAGQLSGTRTGGV